MIRKISDALRNIRRSNNTACHIRRTFAPGPIVDRIERDGLTGDAALWRFVSYGRPAGSAGNLSRIGAMVLVASACGNWGCRDTLADALVSAADAMRLELAVRYKEEPRPGGLICVADALADSIRHFGWGREAVEAARAATARDRHPDNGADFVFAFLENLLGEA